MLGEAERVVISIRLAEAETSKRSWQKGLAGQQNTRVKDGPRRGAIAWTAGR